MAITPAPKTNVGGTNNSANLSSTDNGSSGIIKMDTSKGLPSLGGSHYKSPGPTLSQIIRSSRPHTVKSPNLPPQKPTFVANGTRFTKAPAGPLKNPILENRRNMNGDVNVRWIPNAKPKTTWVASRIDTPKKNVVANNTNHPTTPPAGPPPLLTRVHVVRGPSMRMATPQNNGVNPNSGPHNPNFHRQRNGSIVES